MLSSNAAKWRTIATALRLKTGEVEEIEENHTKDAKKCLTLAITAWFRLEYNVQTNGMPSWKKLAKAVHGIDNALYLRIIEKHNGCQELL